MDHHPGEKFNLSANMRDRESILHIETIFTTARSSESASAFDDETSKLRPIAAAVSNKGSSISLVGVG